MELLGLRIVPFCSHVTVGGGFPSNVHLIVIVFPMGKVVLVEKIEMIATVSKKPIILKRT